MKTINLISLIIVCTCINQTLSIAQEKIIPLILTEKPMTVPIKATSQVNFIAGPSIKPSDFLLNWLNKEINTNSHGRKRLRLPIVVHFEDSDRLALGDAFIGISDKDYDRDPIFLSLDDTGMGRSLLEQLNHICPKTKNSCVVWLEGYWGSLIKGLDLSELPELGQENQPEQWRFTVLKVNEIIEPQTNPSQPIRIWIESP